MTARRPSLAPLTLAVTLSFAWLPWHAAHADERETKTLLFAASSTTAPLEAALAAFRSQAAEGSARASASFAASSVLAKQIASGAPASVFVSANARWVDYLARRKRIEPGSRAALFGTRLVIAVPRGAAPLSLDRGLAAALGTRRFTSGDPDAVPLGDYARAALRSLGWWREAKPRFVPAVDAKAALSLVARGAVAAGVLYEVDARASRDVQIVRVIDARHHLAVRYEIALVAGASAAARRLYRFLRGARAAAIFRAHGLRVGAATASVAKASSASAKSASPRRSAPARSDAPRGEPSLWPIVALSLRVALLCVAISLFPAVLIAWLLARRRFFGKLVVEALVYLPLVLPPIVTGYLLLSLFGAEGPFGGLGLAFSWYGAALAAAAVGFPLMVRAIRLAIESVDPRLEQAAATLGHNRLSTFWRVTLPLAAPGVIAGALLSFARALGEFGATIVFVGSIPGETRTLPLAIYRALSVPGGEKQATQLAAVAVAISFVALLVGEWRVRRAREERRA